MNKTGPSVLLPLTYLGPVSYFKQILMAGKVVLEVHENYVKQTYRNRCRIATANGPLDLIIPVIKVNGNHTRMKDIKIDGRQKWQINHWRSLTSAYSNAPYFIYYAADLERFFRTGFTSLSGFNLELTNVVLELIGEKVSLEMTREYSSLPGKDVQDLRGCFTPKKPPDTEIAAYTQVFSEKLGFIPDLSILDLLFNLGPSARNYLTELQE